MNTNYREESKTLSTDNITAAQKVKRGNLLKLQLMGENHFPVHHNEQVEFGI